MPVDPAFAELLADKRSELRAPPAHVSVDDMRAGNKAYLITAPKTPIHLARSGVQWSLNQYAGDIRRSLA